MAKKVMNKIFLFPLSLIVIFFSSLIIIFSPVGNKNIIKITSTITPTPSPKPISWQTYTDSTDNYQISYPSTWKLIKEAEKIIIDKPNYAKISIDPSNERGITLPIKTWISKYNNKLLNDPNRNPASTAIDIVDNDDVLKNIPNIVTVSAEFFNQDGKEYIFSYNKKIFSITGIYFTEDIPIEEETVSVSSEINEILSTFKFLPDTSTWKTYKNTEHGFEFKHPSRYSVESPCNRMAGLFKYNWVICVFDPLVVEKNIQNDTQNNSDLFYLGSTEGFRFKYNPESMSEIKKLQLGENIFETFYATMYEETDVFYYKIGNFLFINFSDNWHELNPDFDQILSTFKFLPDTSVRENGYIKNAYNKDNKNYIEIDYIEWINDNSAPNGFVIKNNNSLIRTFEVSKSATVSLIDLTGPEITHKKSSFDNFMSVINKTNSRLFWITLNSANQVIEINEQYVP